MDRDSHERLASLQLKLSQSEATVQELSKRTLDAANFEKMKKSLEERITYVEGLENAKQLLTKENTKLREAFKAAQIAKEEQLS